MTARRRRWPFNLRTLLLLIVAAAITLGWTWDKVRQQALSRRHLEATAVINSVYAAYRQDGHWPSEAEFESLVRRKLPQGWRGEMNATGPWIVVGGPLHIAISYQFEPPRKGTIPRTWVFNDEGHETEFEADIAYTGVSPQAPTKQPASQADRP